jgi:hypothetical protein
VKDKKMIATRLLIVWLYLIAGARHIILAMPIFKKTTPL